MGMGGFTIILTVVFYLGYLVYPNIVPFDLTLFWGGMFIINLIIWIIRVPFYYRRKKCLPPSVVKDLKDVLFKE